MANKKKKKIPFKNYVIAILIVIGFGLISVYAFLWYKVYEQKDALEASYLSRVVYEINYDELDDVFYEANSNYFIYIKDGNIDGVNNLEKKLKDIIVDNNLGNSFYYLDVTSLTEDESFVSTLNEKLKLTNKKIVSVPCILFYKEGVLKEIIPSKKSSELKAKDFKRIIEKYELND